MPKTKKSGQNRKRSQQLKKKKPITQKHRQQTTSRYHKTQKRRQRAGSLMNSISQLIHGQLDKTHALSQYTSQSNNRALCAPVINRPDSTQKMGGRRNKGIEQKTVSRHSVPTKVVIKESVHPDSCLTEPVVLKLARAWNTHVRKASKSGSAGSSSSAPRAIRSPAKMPPEQLWEQLRERLGGNSNEPEDHWFQNPVVKAALSESEIEEIKDEHYRPEAPSEWHKRPDAWLSTTDIEDLLEQYEDKYPEFKSYGASPIDFDLRGKDVGREPGQPGAERCMVNPLCNINLRELTKERKTPIKYIGVVFNLDPHDKAGSHWISMFVNLPRQEINFWDSYGYQPPKEVKRLMSKLLKQGRDMGLKKMRCQVNRHRHQYKNSECGMYSSWFIIQQLEGRSFDDVCQNIVRDDEMNKKRRQYYNY